MTLHKITRRTIFGALAALGLAGLAGSAIAEERVSVALDWTPNTNHIGLFVAREKGFYSEAGIEVDILPYTDTSASTLVASGVANFGVMGSISLFTQRTAGADLIGVYPVVQSETGRLVFMDNRADIQSPKDLDGKTYGGFGSAWEQALLSSIIRADGGKGEFRTVTLGTSAYQALENGAVDFTLEVYTWEGVKAELDGVKQRAFRYADFGVPDEHTTILGSSRAFLKDNGAAAEAFIKATRQGYEYAVDHPDEATDLLIAANKGMLTDRALVRASLQALIDGNYLRTADGIAGVFDPQKMEAIGSFLFDAKILKDASGAVVNARPDFSSYYSNPCCALTD